MAISQKRYEEILKNNGYTTAAGITTPSAKTQKKTYKTDGSVFTGLSNDPDYDWHTSGGDTLKAWGSQLGDKSAKLETSSEALTNKQKRIKRFQMDTRYGTDKDFTDMVDKLVSDYDTSTTDYERLYNDYQTAYDRYNAGAETWNKYVEEQQKQYEATYGSADWLNAEAEKAAGATERAQADYAKAAKNNGIWGRLGNIITAGNEFKSGRFEAGNEATASYANAKSDKADAKQRLTQAQEYQGTIEYYKNELEPKEAADPAELEKQLEEAKYKLHTYETMNFNATPDLLDPNTGSYVNPSRYDSDIKATKAEITRLSDELYKAETAQQTKKYAAKGIGYDETVADELYQYIHEPHRVQQGELSINEDYAYMSDDEKAAYYAIYSEQGKKAANEYLKRIEGDVSARARQTEQQRMTELAYEAPFTASALSTAATLASGAGLADIFMQNARNDLAADWGAGEYRPVNYNTQNMRGAQTATAIRGTIAQNLTDKSGKISIDAEKHPLWASMLDGKGIGDLYQLGMSMVDSAATAGIAKALGGSKLAGYLATSLLGGSAGTQGVIDALDKGATDKQALTMGLVNGFFESFFEEFSLDNLINGEARNLVLAILQQGGIEASEEAATTLANTVADALVMAEKSDWQKNVQQYYNALIAQGMDEAQAKKQAQEAAFKAAAGGLLYDAIGGFITGGLMGGGKTAIQNTAANIAAKRIFGDSSQQIVDTALSYDSGDRTALKAEKKLKDGGELTGREIRSVMESGQRSAEKQQIYSLTQQVQKELANPKSEFIDASESTEGRDNSLTAKAVAKKALGVKLTGSEKTALENSAQAKRILADITTTQEQKLREIYDEKSFKQVKLKTEDGTETGELVKLKKSADTGEITYEIRTESGTTTAEAKDVELNDYAQYLDRMLTAALDGKESDSAEAFNLYSYGQSIESYAEEFAAARDIFGASGVSLEATKKSTMLRSLTPAQTEAAWALGHDIYMKQNESSTPTAAATAQITPGTVSYEGGTMGGRTYKGVDRASFTKEEQALDRTVQKISAMWGLDFVLFEDEGRTQGAYAEGGRIWLNIKNASQSAKMLAGQVLSHELTHWMKEYAPKEYAALKKYIIEYILDADAAAFEKMLAQKMQREGISRSKAVDEVIADGCQMMLKSSEAIKELARQNMTLAERIQEKIEDMILDLASLFGKPTHYEAKLLEGAKKLQDLWDAGIKAAADNMARSERKTTDAETGKAREELNRALAKAEIAREQLWTGENTEEAIAILRAVDTAQERYNEAVKTLPARQLERLKAKLKAAEKLLDEAYTWGDKAEIADAYERIEKLRTDIAAIEGNAADNVAIADENTAIQPQDMHTGSISPESGDISFSIKEKENIEARSKKYFDSHRKESKHISDDMFNTANDIINQMAEYMKPFLDVTNNDGKRYLPEEILGKTTFANGSYGKSIENTTICFRTLAYIDFTNEIKKRIGRPLTVEESFLASQMIYDIAKEPQCLYCYVSLDRKAYDGFLLEYTKQRDAAMAKYAEADIDPSERLKPQAKKKSDRSKSKYALGDSTLENIYREYLNGREDSPNQRERFNMWIDAENSTEGFITNADLTTEDRRSEIKNLNNSLSKQIIDAEKYAQGASWAKKLEQYRSYNSDILSMNPTMVEKLNKHYGLRFYSFSEYTPAFIVENMQQIRDAAIKGLYGLAYTKKPDFARIFASTGMNINISVFGRMDNGKVVPDTLQGADWNEVQELRKQYKNVGAVLVATNDAMTEWALAQDWIDVVIPFHIVRTGANVAEFYKWVNNTKDQADVDESGKNKTISPAEFHNDYDTYMKLIEERGLTPRFAKWVDSPNYMKLVNETRLSDLESTKLTPNFTEETYNAAKKSFDTFVEDGGYYGNWYEEGIDYEDAVNTVANDVLSGKRANEVDYGRQDFDSSVAMKNRKNRQHGQGIIRHSTADSPMEGSAERAKASEQNRIRLKAANNELRRTFEKWAGQKELTASAKYNRADLEDVYRELTALTGFNPSSSRSLPMSAAEARERLMRLANYIIENKNETADEKYYDEWFAEATRQADELVGKLLENAWYTVETGTEDIQRITRERVYANGIYLSDALRAEINHRGGRGNFSHLKFTADRTKGLSIDTLWGELAGLAGEGIFDPDTNEGDMLEVIEDILAQQPKKRNENKSYGTNTQELSESIATDLMIRLAAIRERTTAKEGSRAQLQQLRREIEAKNAANTRLLEILASDEEVYEAALKELQENKTAASDTISTVRAQLDRERRRALKAETERETIRESLTDRITELSYIAENTEKIIAAAKAKELAKTERLKQHYDAIIEDLQRPERRATLVRKIQKTEKHLQTFVVENSGQKHVPKDMREPLGAFLLTLDTMPFTGRTASEKSERAKYFERKADLAAVVARQRELAAEISSLPGIDLEQPFIDKLDEYTRTVRQNARGVYNIAEMTYEQLEKLYEVLTMLSTAVNNANALVAGYMPGSLQATAISSIDHMRRLPEIKTATRFSKFAEKQFWDNIMPIDAFEMFGGQKIFAGIVRGWGQLSANLKKLEEFTTDLYTAEEARKWETTEHTFELKTWNNTFKEAGEKETVTLTTAQLMSLYALMQRETLGRMQAQEHIFGGGIRIGEFKRKGKTVSQAKDYNVTPLDWAAMYTELKKDERALEVVKKLQENMNTVGTRWGNEVSMKRWGIVYFTDKNYWPIKTVPDNRATLRVGQEDNNTSLYRLANMGFTKGTIKNANNSIMLESALDAYTNHMADMAKYNSLVLPMLDAMKWYNYYERGEGDNVNTQFGTVSLKNAMEVAYGQSAKGWFEQFMVDLNGASEGGSVPIETAAKKLMRRTKGALVGANLRVIVQQPTSIARAMNEINAKYLAEGVFTPRGKEEMLEYSDVAAWKIQFGFYDVNVNRSMRERIKHAESFYDQVTEGQTYLAGKADEITWTAMWNACKAEVREKQGLTGKELLEATGRRFDEIILKTQVMDSTISRAQVMRKQTLFASAYTSFMAEPIMSANTFIREATRFSYAKRTGQKELIAKSRAGMIRSAAVFALSQALTSLAAAAVDAGRDDDDYQTWLEKWSEHWLDNFLGNINPLTLLPVVNMMWGIAEPLTKWAVSGSYSTSDSNLITQAIGELTELIPLTAEYLGDGEKTKLTYYGNMTDIGYAMKLLNAASKLSGVALGAAARDVRGLINGVLQIWNDFNPDNTVPLLRTYDGGQEGRVKNAVKGGNLTADEAAKELERLGYDSDKAYWTVKQWQTGESKTGNIKNAINANDKAAFEAAAQEYTEHGGDAESAAKTHIKTLYLGDDSTEPLIDRETAEKYLVTYAGMKTDEAKATALEWSCKRTTGIAYSELKDAYIAGRITAATAKQYLMKFGELSSEEADAKVKEYQFAAKWGFNTDELKKQYIDGEITSTQLKTALKDKGVENAEEKAADYEFEKKYKFDPTKTSSLYAAGEISEEQARDALRYKGLSADEIEATLETYSFRKAVPAAEDITAEAVARYNEYASGIDKAEYYKAWKACSTMHGEDADGDGETDRLSKARQQYAYIAALNLSAADKTKLAYALVDISDKNRKKLQTW